MSMKLPKRDDVEIDMAPMIDMVFLLLIFFMVASVMKTEKVPVKIPTADAAKVSDNIKDRITISLDKDGQAYIRLVPVSLEKITEILNDELDANPNTRVFIRADKDVPYKYSKKLIAACRNAAATDLIYAVYEGGSKKP